MSSLATDYHEQVSNFEVDADNGSIKTIQVIGFHTRLANMTDLNARIDSLTAKLTLEEKVSLLTGRDFWNTVPLESIGLRNMLLSDGPAGVRGELDRKSVV